MRGFITTKFVQLLIFPTPCTHMVTVTAAG